MKRYIVVDFATHCNAPWSLPLVGGFTLEWTLVVGLIYMYCWQVRRIDLEIDLLNFEEKCR